MNKTEWYLDHRHERQANAELESSVKHAILRTLLHAPYMYIHTFCNFHTSTVDMSGRVVTSTSFFPSSRGRYV